MEKCVECGLDKVDPHAGARYDVLGDGLGPYCSDCWSHTVTGLATA